MAGAVNKFILTISGDDKLSATIKKINNNVNEMNKPFDRAGKLIDNISKQTGLQKFSEGMAATAAAAGDIAHNIESIMPPLAELVSLGSVAGIASLSENWAAQARHMQLVSRYTDIGTDSLQRWANMATAAGLSGSSMIDEMNIMQQKLQGGVYGRGTEDYALFKALGIDIGSRKYVNRADKILDDIAQNARGRDPVVVQAVLGKLGLSSFAPMMTDLNKYMALASKFNVVMGRDQVEAGEEFQQSVFNSKSAIDGLSKTLGSNLLPVFKPVLDGMNLWIVANREFIATDISKFMGNVWRDAGAVGVAIETIGEKIGLWKDGADAFVKVLEVAVTAAIAKVGIAIVAANARFLATPLGMFIAGSMAAYSMVDKMPEGTKNFLAAPINAWQNDVTRSYNYVTGSNLPIQKYGDMAPDNNLTARDYMGAFAPVAKLLPGPLGGLLSLFGTNAENSNTPAEDKSSMYNGINGAGGDSAASAPAQVFVTFQNAPKGMKVETVSSGDMQAVTRVLHQMPPTGG